MPFVDGLWLDRFAGAEPLDVSVSDHDSDFGADFLFCFYSLFDT